MSASVEVSFPAVNPLAVTSPSGSTAEVHDGDRIDGPTPSHLGSHAVLTSSPVTVTGDPPWFRGVMVACRSRPALALELSSIIPGRELV